MAAIYDMPPFAAYKWMEENKKRLIAADREMVAKAWVQGHTEGNNYFDGGDEDGFAYYDENYGTKL